MSRKSYFRLSIVLKATTDRDIFFSQLWQRFEALGLLGIHEGTLLSEDALRQGITTESWTIDSGEAPRERDWISSQKSSKVDLYFLSKDGADKAFEELRENKQVSAVDAPIEQEEEDWDAQWKASFKGATVPPCWRVLPPWLKDETLAKDQVRLVVNPGAGFGTGTHETTQLCLSEIAVSVKSGMKVLDFGSGSGILGVAAALLGANVDAVEIDPLANDNARENAELNAVSERIHIQEEMGEVTKYNVVIANILRPVLLHFAPDLAKRLASSGKLILSGLTEPDLPFIISEYQKYLVGWKYSVQALGEWRMVKWWSS